MFSSTILDVALGLAFVFLAVSLVASVVVEAISSAMKWRSSHLLEGIKQLVNDPEFTGLAKALYAHAAVNPRGIPSMNAAAGKAPATPSWLGWFSFKATRPTSGAVDLRSSPAYVEPGQFAAAMMDILKLSASDAAAQGTTSAVATMKAALDALLNPAAGGGSVPIQADPQIHQLLTGIVERCRGDLAQIQTEIGHWFDNGMDRLSGEYKRRTQLVSFVVALLVTIAINADAMQVAHALYDQPTLASDLKLPPSVAAAMERPETPPAPPAPADAGDPPPTAMTQAAADALAALDDHLPIGWQGHQSRPTGWGWLLKLLGWLVTAGATLFGAPFWFDTLQSIVRLRGAGPSPSDRPEERAAA